MITAAYSRKNEKRKTVYCLSADGHAGYAPEGQDIICSAVSILMFSLANSLSDSGAYDLNVEMESGHMVVECVSVFADIEIETLFKFTMIGLELLEEQYPDFIEIIEE